MDKKEWVVALATFLAGYYEVASGYVFSPMLSVPISCSVGAVAGGLVLDYILFPNPSRKELNHLFNFGAHAFLWSFVAHLILNQVNVGGGELQHWLIPLIGAYGAAMFKNPYNLF